MAIVLGIDGGGSKTSCVVGDEHTVIGTGFGGPSNIVRVGEAIAKQSLQDAIGAACANAGVTPGEITSSCAGIAGAENPEIARAIRKIMTELASGEIEIVGDANIALHAAFGSGPGVIVIAGTGSVAYGRNLSGGIARAGGWGFAISDEGSGHWIGRMAVVAAFRALDESDASAAPLLDALMKAWGLETREQLVLAANSSTSPNFSVLFPAVLAVAEKTGGVALGTLRSAGRELARLAGITGDKVFSDSKFHAAMCGGVFANSAVVRQVFREELVRLCAQAEVNTKIADPVMGALEMARVAGRSSAKSNG